MERLFAEFENENSLRSYPFASGCPTSDRHGVSIPAGVLVDAALYPVNPTGTLRLSRIGADGVVSISDDKGVVMQAEFRQGASTLEFYDASGLHRHVGTVVASSADALASLANVYEDRRFPEGSAVFSASCVFPVVNDGVTSVDVGSTGAADGEVRFANGSTDAVRVSTGADGTSLRFDVVPKVDVKRLTSIQHIYCVVDGKTPFRIFKIPLAVGGSPGNTIAVYLDNIDRQDVCSNVHREDTLEMVDTCRDCDDPPCSEPVDPEQIPDTFQAEAVDIPDGADGAFYLAVPNMTGYDNPLSITLKDGVVLPNRAIDVKEGADNIAELANSTTSKGVVLQVPGLAASR